MHDQNDIYFKDCYKNYNWTTIKWLYELCRDTPEYGPIDIHSDNEHLFRIVCYKNNLEMAQWVYNLHLTDPNVGKIDIHAKDDEAFRTACRRNTSAIAKWLASIEPTYSVTIIEGSVCDWNIKDIVMDFVSRPTDERYENALKWLNLTQTHQLENLQTCTVCHEPHERIIKLECDHFICLEKGYNIFRSITKKCSYCQKSFDWSKCSSCVYEGKKESDICMIDL